MFAESGAPRRIAALAFAVVAILGGLLLLLAAPKDDRELVLDRLGELRVAAEKLDYAALEVLLAPDFESPYAVDRGGFQKWATERIAMFKSLSVSIDGAEIALDAEGRTATVSIEYHGTAEFSERAGGIANAMGRTLRFGVHPAYGRRKGVVVFRKQPDGQWLLGTFSLADLRG